MPTKRYEISDYQWNQIVHLFPVAKTGRPPKDNRMIFNAILWVARSGSAWRDLPDRYGSWKIMTFPVVEFAATDCVNCDSGGKNPLAIPSIS